MWLIDVETRQLEEFISIDVVPPYAILSHTWEAGQEVLFQEMRQSPGNRSDKGGWGKIDWTCELAARDGLQYAWVDTCCIDKTSSAELSEAINSMYNWYKRSAKCYVYLSDLTESFASESDISNRDIEHCKWFTRGWTLQELIAPETILFYNQEWVLCFDKARAAKSLSLITGVDVMVLLHKKPLSEISVATKMSWASRRRTTRVEDTAYSLLGIFDINMPLLYGEEGKAFLRLQSEIINSCPDASILAWSLPRSPTDETSSPHDLFTGVLAPSPKWFASSSRMYKLSGHMSPDFATSNKGIKMRARFALQLFSNQLEIGCVLPVSAFGSTIFAIQARNIGDGCFVRQDPTHLVVMDRSALRHRLMLEPSLLAQIPKPLIGMHQKRDYILRHRNACLQIILPPDMDIYRRWPWLQWDENDRTFFAGADAGVDWAALKIVTQQPRRNQLNESFDFMFYAFGWASAPDTPAQYMVHRVFGELSDRYLEDMHDRAVTESWDSYWIRHRLRVAKVQTRTAIVGHDIDGETTLLTFHVERVEDRAICDFPFSRVEFSWKFVPTESEGTEWDLV